MSVSDGQSDTLDDMAEFPAINKTVFNPEHLTRIAEEAGLFEVEDEDELNESVNKFCSGTKTVINLVIKYIHTNI